MIIEFILENKELIKILYSLVMIFVCAIIVLKTDRAFKVSDYQGLRYLRNSFFFYGLSFVSIYLLSNVGVSFNITYNQTIFFLSSFFSFVGGLFLIYSLTWKRFEKQKSHNSLLNFQSGIIYLVSLIVSLVILVAKFYPFFEFGQTIVFTILFVISLKNNLARGKKIKFLRYYLVGICFNLFFWVLKTINVYSSLSVGFNILMYTAGSGFYFIFFVGTINLFKKKNG